MLAVKKLFLLLFLSAGLTLCGCSAKHSGYTPPSRIVSYVDIYCQKPDGALTRHYTNPGKVEAILHYVRLLDPNGPAEVTQEALQGDFYEIVIHLQDGGIRVHRQRSDTFAALHRRYWGRIDRSLGMRLNHMLKLLPSDPVDANSTELP